MKSNVLLLAAALFFVSLLVTLNLLFKQNFTAETAEQFNRQQLLLVETISRNIQGNIEHFGEMAKSLAGIMNRREIWGKDLDDFASLASSAFRGESVVDLRIFDEGGVLRYSSLKHPVDDADRLMIERAKGLRKEETALYYAPDRDEIIIATPIAGAGGRLGTLTLEFSRASINKKYLSDIRSGEKGYAWMMDGDGTLLYHPTQPEMVGKNLLRADASCFRCHKSFEAEKRILESGATGVQTYVAPFGEDKIIAFSRLELSPDTFWIACVSVPFTEITAGVRKSLNLHSMLIIAIFITTAAAASTVLLINTRRVKAEESARHEAELERYASELEKAVEKRTMELISEKEKLDAIVGALGVGIFLVDKNKRVIWTNKAMGGWFGEETAKALTIEDIYGGTEISSTVSDTVIQEVVRHRLGQKDGYFQITSTPLVGPDGEMQLIGLIHDITEIKRFEEQLAHSEKLASLGRLTAGIAHEIGNPLTSVFSFLQILREIETDGFKTESLDTIIFHINRIADIVKQLSGLSKPSLVEFKEVQINDVIESSLSLMQYDKRARAISIVRELSPLPTTVTDVNQLSQVFVNLILNAADAMPDGGTLTIRSGQTEGSIEVQVKDTGTGISPEDLPRVFDPFFTTKEKGTGLGLSVSYGIIKGLGGIITVESEPGRGTTFTVSVPKRRHE
jgi:signal transduction histidine kinase